MDGKRITPTLLTNNLRNAVQLMTTDLDFLSEDISAWSLCAAGATTVMLGNVDPDVICLVG